jgi:adenylate cyclase
MRAKLQPTARHTRTVQRWPRIAISLIPLVFALLHAVGWLPWGVLYRLDAIMYDARLRATMPRTLDERIVIVDIDEKSLAQVGQWPWPRHHLAQLMDELFDRQHISVLGFDMVFAEADHSSGLDQLQQLAQHELRDNPAFLAQLQQLAPGLDRDRLLAQALHGRAVVMGYYFTGDREGRTTGVLPAPVMSPEALQGRQIRLTSWNGFGANIAPLAAAAPHAGFFNALTESDGVVRAIPLLAEFQGQYYESLALAMFRQLTGLPHVEPGFPSERFLRRDYPRLENVRLKREDGKTLGIPVDDRVATLVPYRGAGGVTGGSFRYYPAADLLSGRVPPDTLKDKIVLVGTTAPGLMDLRVTPVSEAYPGVEAHANLIAGMIDGNIPTQPDFALGFEVVMLLLSGLTLALGLPALPPKRALVLSSAIVFSLVGINLWLYIGHSLVLPVASALLMAFATFALNMSYGYLVENRAKRDLAHLFGTYVPPELVDEMVKDPDSYSMEAIERELTVMFCDMRGFTRLSEELEPTQLQALLNTVFSRLTHIIRSHRGTIDKYMGDCVMAFWGAPVETPEHANLAVVTALAMVKEVDAINREHRAQGLPEISVGIGLHTGKMLVGDMGSDIRRSYTVIGDAVNLGSRLEGLSKVYGCTIIASEATQRRAPEFLWQELDRVRVKGKEQAVTIYRPSTDTAAASDQTKEMSAWSGLLRAYRAQDWEQCDVFLLNLMRINANNYLYQLYASRIALRRTLPFDPSWDGATDFETK